MNSSAASPPEQQSTKAARLLASAGELLLSRGARGFTVADVAKRAHVGKGTVYLYWPTKEDLHFVVFFLFLFRFMKKYLKWHDMGPRGCVSY